MTKQEILDGIGTVDLSADDIREIDRAIRDRYRLIAHRDAAAAIAKLRPGLRVSFGDRGRSGSRGYKVGTIRRVNRSTVTVDVDGSPWTVAATLVHGIPRETPGKGQ